MNKYFVDYKPTSSNMLNASIFKSINAKSLYLHDSRYALDRVALVATDLNLHDFIGFLENQKYHGMIHSSKAYPSNNVDIKQFSLNDQIKISLFLYDTNINSIEKSNNSSLASNSFKNELDERLSKIVGLKTLKEDIKQIHSFYEVSKERKKRGISDDSVSLHSVFSGPPGTGKTTIAREIGKIFKETGMLKKGHFVEVDRSGLIDKFLGATEPKTLEKLNEAKDGILFIDEAYSLTKKSDNDKDPGKDAIATILKFMEDNKDRIAIFVAGYGDEMDDFLKFNPGLKSRFTNHYNFDSYSANELLKIFDLQMKDKYEYSKNFKMELKKYFRTIINENDPKYFGNGREVRNTCEALKKIQSNRIFNTKDFKEKDDKFFKELTIKDIRYLKNKSTKSIKGMIKN